MNIFQAIVLGLIQGITEFLPISSSAHLIVVPIIFKWPQYPLVFDVTLHLGTALALIIFFWKDLFVIVNSLIKETWAQRQVFLKKNFKSLEFSGNSYLGLKILVGCLPALFLGLLLKNYFENHFREIPDTIVFLSIGSALLFAAEIFLKKIQKVSIKNLSFVKAFVIGVFQFFALFPGISRSGATISGGIFTGLNREDAARFSFLLSVPVVVGAAVLELATSIKLLNSSMVIPMIFGVLASFVSGILAIKFLLNFLKGNKLYIFIIYRVLLAFILLSFVRVSF
ncbi:undecaprenyl-diphosphatase UppP [candidate division WWE3 bacterium RBG_13_37_7]|uniref:Undecaprenyl-diphosphatase n=1 Tax=candidate division WWE3 bacterium RBG_13_37_7 TaxID=1802609 RepID=A0A1F4U0K6_UNCKA|nr:MAG: undecaprenyl-diphosphatase UppP [candidate division WWE3 bacterium RBG_13_37_7]